MHTAPHPNGHDVATDAADDTDVLLRADSITVGYGPVTVVRDLDLVVRRGQIVVLMGPNGAGKTTTLLALSGSLPLQGGTVEWKGRSTNASLHQRARDGLTLVGEGRGIFKQLTVRENLKVGRTTPDRVLDHFPELEKRLDVKAGLISGGEQQMLAIGRAISRDAELLVLDELSLGLAPLVVDRLLRALVDAAAEGTAVLLVEQNVRKALEVADHGYLLERGQVVVDAPAAELRERLTEIEASYFGQPA